MSVSLVSARTMAPAMPRHAARSVRALRYIPVLALGLDVVVVIAAVLAAIAGRESIVLPVQEAPIDLSARLGYAGPAMVVAWIVAIVLFGGYRPSVFGAGLDEYKRVISSSLRARVIAFCQASASSAVKSPTTRTTSSTWSW